MSRIAFAAAIVSLAVMSHAGGVETVILHPAETATISGETDGATDPRILLSFNLSSVPENARILSAGLALTGVGSVPWRSPFVPATVGAMASRWDPASVDWSGPSSGQDWSSPGGDWNPEYTSYRVIVRDARAPSRFHIEHFVKAWIDGSISNYGLIVMLQGVADLQDITNSFNATALNPSLKIRYTLPSG